MVVRFFFNLCKNLSQAPLKVAAEIKKKQTVRGNLAYSEGVGMHGDSDCWWGCMVIVIVGAR